MNNRKVVLSLLLISLLTFSSGVFAEGNGGKLFEKIKNDDKFYVCAHRGYSSDYPENTLIAFYEAIKIGVDMIECDIRLSKDNVPVIIHDETVDRTTNGEGLVAEMTVDQLKELDAGVLFAKRFEGIKIPTFKEFCELVAPYEDLVLNLEIKSSTTVIKTTEEVMKLVKHYGLTDNIIINSFDAEVINYAKNLYNVATQGFPDNKMKNFKYGDNGTYSKMWTAAVQVIFLGNEHYNEKAQEYNKQYYSRIVQEFKDIGIVPHSYVTNDEEAVNFVIDCGFKFTACDNPVPALRVAEERGLR